MTTTNTNLQNSDMRKNIIFLLTGDPFVDTGALVIKTLVSYFPQKSLMEMLEYITNVYINHWGEKLHAVFHTNSKLMNPSRKGKHKKDTIKYFKDIIEGNFVEDCIEGYCKTCGRKGVLYSNSRSFFPLSGSGAFVNFHHAHEGGSFLCSDCTIKLYFVPLGVLKLGRYIGLLHAQSVTVRNYIVKTIIRQNLDKIQRQASESILASVYSNPRNALFHFASEIITEIENEEFSEYLQLFHFTNFANKPDCMIYTLPNSVFCFLNKVLRYHKQDWYSFIKRYYRIKYSHWDDEMDALVIEKKKEKIVLTDKDCINYPNIVYERLLSNQSILPQLLRVYRGLFQNKVKQIHLMIAIYYVTEVLGMKQEQLGLIKRIAEVVLELSQRENNYKKYLVLLERTRKAYELRAALLKIIKANYRSGAKEPLIRLEEYVNYLFPDGQYWSEIRDLMLIYLYEKLHEIGVNSEEIPEDVIEVAGDEPINNF